MMSDVSIVEILHNEIAILKECTVPNWNNEDAIAIPKELIDIADNLCNDPSNWVYMYHSCGLLDSCGLLESSRCHKCDCPNSFHYVVPKLSPVPSGTVEISWSRPFDPLYPELFAEFRLMLSLEKWSLCVSIDDCNIMDLYTSSKSHTRKQIKHVGGLKEVISNSLAFYHSNEYSKALIQLSSHH